MKLVRNSTLTVQFSHEGVPGLNLKNFVGDSFSFMKKSLVSILLIVALAGCGGSNSSNESLNGASSQGTEAPKNDGFTSAAELRDALGSKGFVCSDFTVTAVADRDIGQEGAVDVAQCDIEGENVGFSIWKDNGQRDNFTGMLKTFGCQMAKGFGISTMDYAKGDKWTISGVSQTLTEKLADALEADASHIKC